MAQQDLPFARDFGYLDKFLTNLRTHAETLPEPQRGELAKLVAAEASHWDRIKDLLGGEPTAAPANPPSSPVGSAPRGLTVGSLLAGR